MGALLRFAQPKTGPALNHVELVQDPVTDELVDRQRPRHAVDQCQHVAAERVLQLGVLEQLIEYDPRLGVTLEDDHQALAGAVRGVIAQVSDTSQLA